MPYIDHMKIYIYKDPVISRPQPLQAVESLVSQ